MQLGCPLHYQHSSSSCTGTHVPGSPPSAPLNFYGATTSSGGSWTYWDDGTDNNGPIIYQDQPTHMVVTYETDNSGVQTMKLYINGVYRAFETRTGTPLPLTSADIGSCNEGQGGNPGIWCAAKGTVHKLRMYNGLLTTDQIAALAGLETSWQWNRAGHTKRPNP